MYEPTARLRAAIEEAHRQQKRARVLVAEVRAARIRERESLALARARARALGLPGGTEILPSRQTHTRTSVTPLGPSLSHSRATDATAILGAVNFLYGVLSSPGRGAYAFTGSV